MASVHGYSWAQRFIGIVLTSCDVGRVGQLPGTPPPPISDACTAMGDRAPKKYTKSSDRDRYQRALLDESVSRTADGKKVLRRFGIDFELRAKLRHKVVDSALGSRGAPNLP